MAKLEKERELETLRLNKREAQRDMELKERSPEAA